MRIFGHSVHGKSRREFAEADADRAHLVRLRASGFHFMVAGDFGEDGDAFCVKCFGIGWMARLAVYYEEQPSMECRNDGGDWLDRI